MNPFITLTRIQGKGPVHFQGKGPVHININSIVLYERRTYSDSPRQYTYILVQGGQGCSREVEETPEQIDDLIQQTILSNQSKTESQI